MTRTTFRRLCLSLAALAALSTASLGHAARPADDDGDLPETLRRSYVAPIDGPADDRAYAHGTLGLLRPEFGRASLYVAWRVMHVPVGSLAKENHRRQAEWIYQGPTPRSPTVDEIDGWLAARAAVVPKPPADKPDYFRHGKMKVPGVGEIDTETGNCGPDAFAFATRTLRELAADASVGDGDRRAWVAGQDAVFARCSWTPGTGKPPAAPAALPTAAPARMQALNAYQQASAQFYADDFDAARRAFDAIAATPDHPMRAWAALGAMRSVLRAAVNDAEWNAAFDDAWRKRQLRGPALDEAIAEPARQHHARVEAALKDLDERHSAAMKDPAFAAARPAIAYTGRRALEQLAPGVVLGQAMNALDRVDRSPYASSALDMFQSLYPRVSPDRPTGPIATTLRQHDWFDWTLTIQACGGVAVAPSCTGEHAHALARWQETKDSAWLLAALMTARQPSAADLPAADAARAVGADRPEWASLQFYASRVLRAQGRGADARTAMDALAASPVVHKRDAKLVQAERAAL